MKTKIKAKQYILVTKREVLKHSVFIGVCVCMLAGSFRYGLLSFIVTVLVWSLIMYLLSLAWYAFFRKKVDSIARKLSGKIKGFKKAGEQNTAESDA